MTNEFTLKNLKLVDLARDAPALKFDDPEDYAHMLKRRDRDNVAHIVETLQGTEVDVYLIGSTLNNQLSQGNREYNDIDLLAVGDYESGTPARDMLALHKHKGALNYGNTTFRVDEIRENLIFGDLQGQAKLAQIYCHVNDIQSRWSIYAVEPFLKRKFCSEVDLTLADRAATEIKGFFGNTLFPLLRSQE
ncbi:hypothetical protein HOC13_03400 [Candidatus Woesearchaeota archaeon]|nr:hypothetical protein [Candidatus Woesearchaeota archaeon]